MEDSKTNEEIILEGKEKDIKNSNIVPFCELYESLRNIRKYICRLEFQFPELNETKIGTGTLLKLQKGNNPLYCLLTCEHVIKEQFIKKNKELEIRYNYTSKGQNYYKLSIILDEDKRFIKTYRYLGIDATIVQILPDKDDINVEFFFENNLIDDLAKDNYKELEKKYIQIFQFPGKGDILSYSTGEYLENYEINGFLHSASTDRGSSGSPMIYFYDNKPVIFGIHKAGKKAKKLIGKVETELNKGECANLGNFIFPIINSLRKDNIIFVKDLLFKGLKFTGDLLENDQKGELYILNKEINKYDKIYIGELSYFEPNGKGILYKIKNEIDNNELLKTIKNTKIEKYKIYCGEFNKGKYYGYGILYYNEIETDFYKGQFKDNLRNGKGKYYENNKLVYEGDFKDDTYDGKGKLYNENGNYYEGEFTKGKKNGDGKEYDNKGNIVGEDEYKNNEPVSIANLEDTVMRVLSFGNEFLKSIGLSPNYTCENCGCSTDDHYLIEKNIWECKKCKEKCVNVLMENLK